MFPSEKMVPAASLRLHVHSFHQTPTCLVLLCSLILGRQLLLSAVALVGVEGRLVTTTTAWLV